MIKLPFDRFSFTTEMKSKISGTNITLEFDNVESGLSKVALEMMDLLSEALYEKICNTDQGLELSKDFLSRSMLHFALYEQGIYLIAKISNDGITVKKNDNETTIFKYQQDLLTEKLIEDGWFWFNRLVKALDKVENLQEWSQSPAKKDLTDIPITSADFKKWVGVDSEYFILQVRWIIREVWTECVLSRSKAPQKTDEIIRAICYEVLARATRRLAYHALPKPIRVEMNSEMTKANSTLAETDIREKLSAVYQKKADGYWIAVDAALSKQEQSGIASSEVYKPTPINQNDSFCA
ncbi:MAG: hypothetical protein JW783_08250 [Bacteroidales bacterium]|nr:hypothetical protein [Bacteroidales bacterium]MBN2749932.1 hypothetical protein [Bacteroidales bacterium]